jgi:pimeloyl-ACP methyl ester carboxylesterase
MTRHTLSMGTAGAVLLAIVPARALEPQTVTFETDDGVSIVADFYPSTGRALSPVAILLPMYRHDRSSWTPLIPHLHDAGFAVLAIDPRGHGDSVKPKEMDLARRVRERDPTLFRAMYRDVFAGYHFLSQQPNCDLARVALVGASVGCSVAIDYASRDRSVDVVVCLSPGENYLGLDSRAHMKKFAESGPRAILLLAAPQERKACDTLAGINPHTTVRIVGQDKVHGTGMFGAVKGIEEDITRFLVEHVGQATEHPVVGAIDGDECFNPGSREAMEIDEPHRRYYSSAEEAAERGLKVPVSPTDGMLWDGAHKRPPEQRFPERQRQSWPQTPE